MNLNEKNLKRIIKYIEKYGNIQNITIENSATTFDVKSSGGIGFVGLLTIAFIVLKLTEVIDWSWWWVLSPLWISFCVGLIILIVVGIVFGIIWLFNR